MNINQYLKSIKKTKFELAEDLRISRPTLNQYIELYEKGQKIENERYNIIFKRLFSELQLDRDLFEKKLISIKNLLERDRKYDIGCLEPKAADLVARIHNNMVNDMSRGEWSEKVYDAILILLSRYRDYPIMRELAGYFSDLNSDSDISSLSTISKAYYAYYYKCFLEIRDNPPEYNAQIYNEFITRREYLSKEREEQSKNTEKKVQDYLDKMVKEVLLEFQKNGIEATEKEIMNEVVRRMNRLETE